MEPSNEPIAVRITKLNRQILGKVTSGITNSIKLNKKTIDREALLDALTVLYDECNDDPVKRSDELVHAFVDKYRSTLAELRRTRVCLSDFEVLQTIGRGYFGDVHMVREKQTGDVYALKTLRKELARKRAAGAVEDERDVLVTATSPWIPRLQYAFQDNNHLYLVMELCSGGDLAALLARRGRSGPLLECDAAFYIAEVTHALKALHEMGYVHRDLKPHNILIDRCGHVKLGDFGSCVRLSEGGVCSVPVGTADYVAPELLAAAACAQRHTVCLEYCRGIGSTAITACDYWSLGVMAFELVTLKRPFSSGDDDSISAILSNIQKYERAEDPEALFSASGAMGGAGDGGTNVSSAWRSLVGGLLRVLPARRFSYLDTLQHAALAHLPVHLHTLRDQAPPWVPCLRGVEDASYFEPPPRDKPPPTAAPFRTRPPFAGQLPFVGYSYVALDDNEEHSTGFNISHDCTAIDLATFKSAEKLAAMRGREVAALQKQLAAGEAAAGAALERARRDADLEAERQRARLQADITALSLENRRLERQVEVEKEERMALQRTNQELSAGACERHAAELRAARAEEASIRAERDALKVELHRLEMRLAALQSDHDRALVEADDARTQHKHYKDSVAKERAIRRQTISGEEAESREVAMRLAAAEAKAARDTRAKELLEKKLADSEAQVQALSDQLNDLQQQLATTKDSLREKQRIAEASTEQLKEVQAQLTQEQIRISTLVVQNQELERGIGEAARREAGMEEQYARTEARFTERLRDAETRAAHASSEHARHRDKVNSLEQLVRQLEREVSALERRSCTRCESPYMDSTSTHRSADTRHEIGGTAHGKADSAHSNMDTTRAHVDSAHAQVHSARAQVDSAHVHVVSAHIHVDPAHTPDSTYSDAQSHDIHSDTESVADNLAQAQVALLKEQLKRAELQLQARTEEIAALRQEARAANLAKWRKERECNDLSLEVKANARDIKRLEERLALAIDARKSADQKVSALQSELTELKPKYERTSEQLNTVKTQYESLQKAHETAQAEIDRSRNDIRKLKSELLYSEKRRLHAEEQEELSSRERAQLRDELQALRRDTGDLVSNNKALQETCSLLEDQLNDLEKLSDIHEVKNKDLEAETQRLRGELEQCRARLGDAERQAAERGALADQTHLQLEQAREQARHDTAQIKLLQERLESREVRVVELEGLVAALEGRSAAREAALGGAARRLRDMQEECAALRSRAHHHHSAALQLQASLADAQEELSAAREAAEAATAWWRTRETKSDATLRQQAKLIDFLQAKVEEASRKKCSLSNKLFGRSGRRPAASPPLRRANRELREEVERLRAKLAVTNGSDNFPPTPKREKARRVYNGLNSIDSPDGIEVDTLQIVWSTSDRERMRARCSDEYLILTDGNKELRAQLLTEDAKNLPQNEANRAFTIKVENTVKGREAAVVCSNLAERSQWLSRLRRAALAAPVGASGYSPTTLLDTADPPNSAFFLAPNAVALGYADGLRSLRGPVQLVLEGDGVAGGVRCLGTVCGRAVFACGAGRGGGGGVAHAALAALASTLQRSAALHPALPLAPLSLPDHIIPDIFTVAAHEAQGGACAAVAGGRRVFLLRFDAANVEFKIARSLTVEGAAGALLLTRDTLYVCGARPLSAALPAAALRPFAPHDATVAAAASARSEPRAMLLVRPEPREILVCYAECGVFLDEAGRRTRPEDARWPVAVSAWEFVAPFLYLVGEDRVVTIYLSEDAYRGPPCTCDATSLASSSSSSDCLSAETFTLRTREPALLAAAPTGILIRSKTDEGFRVSLVEGAEAFRSIGASVESLETVSDGRGSCPESAGASPAPPECEPEREPELDLSPESTEPATGFLADIRKRARQLRHKHRDERTPDDIIKQILTTEVGLPRNSSGRKSPASSTEFDSDSTDTEENPRSKDTADLCAEMFARQVRFQ